LQVGISAIEILLLLLLLLMMMMVMLMMLMPASDSLPQQGGW